MTLLYNNICNGNDNGNGKGSGSYVILNNHQIQHLCFSIELRVLITDLEVGPIGHYDYKTQLNNNKCNQLGSTFQIIIDQLCLTWGKRGIERR